jgi:flagellar hook-associated protein 3 FlgL
MMVDRALSNLNQQTRRVLQLQDQLATGLKVNSPSDNPLAARRAINIRATMSKNEQYMTNISSAQPILSETESAVQTVVSILQRAQELTVQGASGTNSQTQLNQLAIEMNQLVESMVTQANHQTSGRFIFGGTRTSEAPYVATRDGSGQIASVAYQGNDEDIRIPVADGISVTVNETGTNAFQNTQDVFQLLIDTRDNLLAGDRTALTTRLAENKLAQDQSLISLSRVGAIQNRLEALNTNTEDYVEQLKQTLSDNIDADYAETVVNLDAQTNAFNAALSATARVIQRSLLDFVS